MELDTSTTAQPHSLSNPHHRKIELQSPPDLTYLQANLFQCAQQKLDLHFPRVAAAAATTNAKPAEYISLDGPRAANSATATDASTSTQHQTGTTTKQKEKEGEEEEEEADPLRTRVHTLLTAFLARTWANALPSISINGLDAPPSLLPPLPDPSIPGQAHGSGQREETEGVDYTYSAFDGKLQQRVASLYAEVEALTAQVSRLRREAPARGAAGYVAALKGVMEEDDNDDNEDEEEEIQHQRQQQQQQGGGAVVARPGLELEGVRSGWHDDVESMYERGVDELVRLAGLKRSDGGATTSSTSGSGDGSLTATVGKVQRATSVAMEFDQP